MTGNRPRHKRWIWVALGLLAPVILLVGLFLANGLWPSWRTPEFHTTDVPPQSEPAREVRVLAFNIAKCFAHRGGLRFAPVKEVAGRLDEIAAIINDARPDLVFLSEIDYECAPCPINQVDALADRTNTHAVAFGENYNWGLPFYRIRSGNALLSRLPVRAVATEQLCGGTSVFYPMNNRRVLWCEVQVDGEWILAGSVRNDSFDLANNLKQTRQLLAHVGSRPAILAGDFNAERKDASIQEIERSGRFSGEFDGPQTYPAGAPTMCIDFVFAPREWTLIEHRVIATTVSDHRPVLSVFQVAAPAEQ